MGNLFSIFFSTFLGLKLENSDTYGIKKEKILVLIRLHFENLRIFAAEFGFKLK
jgi:hypothetical protein